MTDYKSMYYHLSGRMATTIEVLGTTTEMLQATSDALATLKGKLEQAQKATESMFLVGDDEDETTE